VARRVVLVSNRQPYSHRHAESGIEWTRNAGGLNVGLSPVAHGEIAIWGFTGTVTHPPPRDLRYGVEGTDRRGGTLRVHSIARFAWRWE